MFSLAMTYKLVAWALDHFMPKLSNRKMDPFLFSQSLKHRSQEYI